MTMTKKEVAEYLGVSVRTVEGYIEKKKLNPTLATGVRGKVSVFDKEEVERLKTERGEVVYTPPAKVKDLLPPQALQARQSNPLGQRLLDVLEGLQSSGKGITANVPIADKLTLSLDEAAKLSGLSRGHLREAITGKRLKARIIGRGWRVKRDDLDAYVKKL
jgi:excisionase family DNA binding protein